MRLRFPLLALFCFAAVAAAQKPGDVVYQFQANAGEVLLQVSVADSHHHPIANLKPVDFKLSENGQPQEIETFGYADTAVSLGILVDNSGSMLLKRYAVNHAAINFIQTSNPGDEVFLASFNNEYELRQPFTNNLPLLRAQLAAITASGGTKLYDSLSEALAFMNTHAHHDKKVLLLITDGNDTSSKRKLAEAVADAQAGNGVLVYCIGIEQTNDSDDDRHKSRAALQALANATGGLAFFPQDDLFLDSLTKQIASDVRQQYNLVYRSNQPAPGFHAVHVAVMGGDGKPLDVRTRSGYYVAQLPMQGPPPEQAPPGVLLTAPPPGKMPPPSPGRGGGGNPL